MCEVADGRSYLSNIPRNSVIDYTGLMMDSGAWIRTCNWL